MPITTKKTPQRPKPSSLFPSRIDVYIHGDTGGQQPVLTQILAGINTIIEKVEIMSAELDSLATEVQEETTIMESAVTLIGGLADQIRALANDPVKLKELADSLDQSGQKLAASVAANTPAAPGGGGGEPAVGKKPR